ncbi:hypothetical protein FC764_16935 [Clostridium botulinum]|nr:hypothetical protein [Clostridium botulinum]
MEVQELISFIKTSSDKKILETMLYITETKHLQDMENVFCTYIESYPLESDQKEFVIHNVLQLNEDTFGAMMTLIALNKILVNMNEMEIFKSCTPYFIGYFIGQVGKRELVIKLWEIRDIVGLSNKFYDGLIDYYATKKQKMLNSIIQRLRV